jgi:hypothetical protein
MASRALYRNTRRPHKCQAKRLSGHIAYALVAYTLLLIFMVAPVLKTENTAIWPYLLLVAFVGVAIVPCRNLERRWQANVGEQSEGLFRRDVIILWVAALGIPTLLMLSIGAIS